MFEVLRKFGRNEHVQFRGPQIGHVDRAIHPDRRPKWPQRVAPGAWRFRLAAPARTESKKARMVFSPTRPAVIVPQNVSGCFTESRAICRRKRRAKRVQNSAREPCFAADFRLPQRAKPSPLDRHSDRRNLKLFDERRHDGGHGRDQFDILVSVQVRGAMPMIEQKLNLAGQLVFDRGR